MLCGPRDNEDDSSDDDQVLCREPAHGVYERDESFTRQIQSLFHILQLVEKQAGERHAQADIVCHFAAQSEQYVPKTHVLIAI